MSNPWSPKWLWLGAGVVGGAALTRWQLARLFTEQPHYDVEQNLGDLEIRVYRARWVAETTVTDASFELALDEGFRRLAGYIFGDNRPSPFQPNRLGNPGGSRASTPTAVAATAESNPPAEAFSLRDPPRQRSARAADDGNGSAYVIPMPSPALAPPKRRPEKIAMTSPVNVSTGDDRSYTIAFNLPEDRTLATLPAPNDERVRLERRPRRRVAVLRYRGRYSGARVAQKFSELLSRVRALSLGYRGSPEFAGYDPPTTLPWLRRNEVWLELDPS